MTQEEALKILKTGANVFLTGEPGSGKTHTINEYVAYLRSHGIEPAITASTGIAATHIGGYTIHSWSGTGVKQTLTAYDLDRITQSKTVSERIRGASVLIIDEVSMLSARVLSMVDAVCREVRQIQMPFGGLQVVLVGDFFQLPPVSKRGEGGEQDLFEEYGGGEQFAFEAPVWRASNMLTCYLSEQHRQEDDTFLQFLAVLRDGAADEPERELLRTRYSKYPPEEVTVLYTHNVNVDARNDTELGKLASDSVSFEMTSQGSERLVQTLKRGCLSPETLTLKEGARVMFTKNDVHGRYVNGTLGEVVGFEAGTNYPRVLTREGFEIVAEPVEWHLEDAGKILARISQVPLRLAWAITVHKSQGMSLDAAHMDLSQVFEYGQGYVALSRVRTLAGLTLSGLNARALEVHPEILKRDEEFRTASDAAREAFAGIPEDEYQKMCSRFIKACGGSEKEVVPTKKEVSVKPKQSSLARYRHTLEELEGGKSIKEMAKELGVKEETVIGHLEKLLEKGEKIERKKLKHLEKGKEKQIANAIAEFKKLGEDERYLKPVHEALDGKASYLTIRLARTLGGFTPPTLKKER